MFRLCLLLVTGCPFLCYHKCVICVISVWNSRKQWKIPGISVKQSETATNRDTFQLLSQSLDIYLDLTICIHNTTKVDQNIYFSMSHEWYKIAACFFILFLCWSGATKCSWHCQWSSAETIWWISLPLQSKCPPAWRISSPARTTCEQSNLIIVKCHGCQRLLTGWRAPSCLSQSLQSLYSAALLSECCIEKQSPTGDHSFPGQTRFSFSLAGREGGLIWRRDLEEYPGHLQQFSM